MSMFDQILDIVYTEKVREDEGGSYGVYAGGSISRYPEGQTMLQIVYDTDPAKMEKLNQVIFRELESIAQNGPREADFTKVKEYMNKSYNENLKENSYWMNILDTKYFYGEDNHTEYLKTVNSVTSKDIQEFAKKLISQGNQATVVMMPKQATTVK
ncbi:MAG: Peptidase M16 inactive domain protein [Bacteroidetes bacterium ADurb.BinA261]|nr:MAG: Peptidase M16 inactive domain protein [Bacteroidetes bacterium ADurb.BinA261]